MYYIFLHRIINNEPAYKLYQQYISASKGQCPDVIQDDSVDDLHTEYAVFRLVDFQNWMQFPFELRFEEHHKTGLIQKSDFMTAREILDRKNESIEYDTQGDFLECFEDPDLCDEDEDYEI